MLSVSDAEVNIRVELDPDQQAAWVMRGGTKVPFNTVKFGMRFVNRTWTPTQGALLFADSLEEINQVMGWLQERYPDGPPKA